VTTRFTVCLWFDDQAEEAVAFYTGIFLNSKVGTIARYTESSAAVAGRPKGSIMTISFELDGQEYIALNGGPLFQFTPALSLVVYCEDQAEVDHYYERLSEGGSQDPCGWLTDRFGVSWQVVPRAMKPMMKDPDEAKQERMFQAMLQMKKLEVAALEQAFNAR